MMLSGNLSDWSVGDLLQMLHITKKTASLHVEGVDRSGVVHFEEGAIVNAEVSLGGGPDGDPRAEVVEAVYVLELLDEGAFEIKNEVPPRVVEPLGVSEALELAGEHLTAERQLDETGLLSARGLRLAQTIDEPITLSEQVWNAVSVSIPAFTFPELEARLGRAAAVATVEQFRDLGILEAVLDEQEPIGSPAVVADPFESADLAELAGLADASDDEVDSHLAEAFAGSWMPTEEDQEFVTPVDTGDVVPPYAEELVPSHGDEIVPQHGEEVRPIVAEAADDSIIVPNAVDEAPEAEPVEVASPGLTPGASSLSAAIRAAAGVAGAGASSDDEAQLLSEAAGDRPVDGAAGEGSVPPGGDGGSLRRTVKSLVSQPESPQATGVLGDLGSRFRQAAAAEQED